MKIIEKKENALLSSKSKRIYLTSKMYAKISTILKNKIQKLLNISAIKTFIKTKDTVYLQICIVDMRVSLCAFISNFMFLDQTLQIRKDLKIALNARNNET